MTKNVVTTWNPATGERLAEHPAIGRDELNTALDKAVATQREWRSSSPVERSARLRSLATLLREEVEQHARLISLEMGKPITEARAEVLKCALTCDYYAEH